MHNKADRAASTAVEEFSFIFPQVIWCERFLWDLAAATGGELPVTIADLAASSGRPPYEVWQELIRLQQLESDIYRDWSPLQAGATSGAITALDLRPDERRRQQPWPWAREHTGVAWREVLRLVPGPIVVISDRPEQAYSAALWLRDHHRPESFASWPE